jgi:microcystin-dependent protein
MTAWNEATYPADSLKISDIPLVFRQLQFALSDLWEPEHTTIAGNYAASAGNITGFQHKEGSAIAYYEDSAPTNQPDGATSLTTSDAGRVWFDSDDANRQYVWTGSAWSAVGLPVGVIQMWAGVYTAPPTGWLICRGGAVSRSVYSDLFALIGTTYGSGNGSTTFTLPNFQGRVPIGMASTYALGAIGGYTTHTLTTNEMPAHTHTYTRPDNGLSSLTGNTALRDRSPGAATGSTGGGAAHNNMQPYLSINYIIKH